MNGDDGDSNAEDQGPAGRYGGIQAVKGVDLEVARGRTGDADRRQRRRQDDHAEGHHRACSRMRRATSGTWASRIKGVPAHGTGQAGLAMVPEGRGMFTRMTITENLQMGAYMRNDKDGIAGRHRAACSASSRA